MAGSKLATAACSREMDLRPFNGPRVIAPTGKVLSSFHFQWIHFEVHNRRRAIAFVTTLEALTVDSAKQDVSISISVCKVAFYARENVHLGAAVRDPARRTGEALE